MNVQYCYYLLSAVSMRQRTLALTARQNMKFTLTAWASLDDPAWSAQLTGPPAPSIGSTPCSCGDGLWEMCKCYMDGVRSIGSISFHIRALAGTNRACLKLRHAFCVGSCLFQSYERSDFLPLRHANQLCSYVLQGTTCVCARTRNRTNVLFPWRENSAFPGIGLAGLTGVNVAVVGYSDGRHSDLRNFGATPVWIAGD